MSSAPRALLLGHPVAHSASPRIMSALAKASGRSLDYSILDVLPENLAPTLEQICADPRVIGLNFTLPHKIEAARISEERAKNIPIIGSANMWARSEQGFCAYNTDGPGFINALKHKGISLMNRDVITLGAGGAARGVSYACLMAGAKHVFVWNRSNAKAKSLSEMIPGKISALDDLAKLPESFELPPLIINATSLGLKASDQGILDKIIMPFEGLLPNAIATDLVYSTSKERTPFLRIAEQHGFRVVESALAMLALQAVEAFNLWLGQSFSPEEALKVLLPILED